MPLKPDPFGSMRAIRTAQLGDLDVVASWLSDSTDCERWAGHRVVFPIDLGGLPDAIEWGRAESWTVTFNDAVVAFGQLVPKVRRRVHLARLITTPEQRGRGFGRAIAEHLLECAYSRHTDRVSLNVSPANAPAIGLYRSLGFSEAPRPTDEPASDSMYMEHAAQPAVAEDLLMLSRCRS